MNITSNIVHCLRCIWHVFPHVWLYVWQSVTWRWKCRQLPKSYVYLIYVGSVASYYSCNDYNYCKAKFEQMKIWNSFCGMYLMAFLIFHDERTRVQIDHFLCLLHLWYFCTTGRGICCILIVLLGHMVSNYSCRFCRGSMYLCSLTVLVNY
jgi:hypothetical protein